MQNRWHASARQRRLVVLMRKSSEIEVDVAAWSQPILVFCAPMFLELRKVQITKPGQVANVTRIQAGAPTCRRKAITQKPVTQKATQSCIST